ncbi:MAG: alkaline phosphatase family protein [Erysipelotrichaceae bacterium]|nr:alkaline phosphatase family protein [Erysipelotrichaceae bacterium]
MLSSHGAIALAEAVRRAYEKGETDYYLSPLVGLRDGKAVGKVEDGDSVIFCCRRGEREIELTEMFTDEQFSQVDRLFRKDLYFAILTLYNDKFSHLPVAFGPEHVSMPLAEVLSQAGKTQFHCAESEKYAHVTFFFNGGNNDPYPGEKDLCVPSLKGVPFDQVPQLKLPEVAEKVREALGSYDFIVTNFANGDVIGHTSNSEAKIIACNKVDHYLREVVEDAVKKDYVVLITADHGNIETLRTPKGDPHVAHTTNPVALIGLDHGQFVDDLQDGALSDVATTVLHIMGLEKPREMTGRSLTEKNFGENRKVLLVICDGWGIGSHDDNDAIHLAYTPYWDYLMAYPHSYLNASGTHVGLAAGKPGNSEAGHSNLGAGRCVMQDDVRIDKAIAEGSFLDNEIFKEAVLRAKDNGKALHLLSYLTYKSSHGSIEYALQIAQLARNLEMDRVYLHIIFDGRSTLPGSAPEMLEELERRLGEIGVGLVVDGIGRGLVLDRDKNWDKVKKGYDAMVEGKGTEYTI